MKRRFGDDEYWMKRAFDPHKEGSCHRMLGVPRGTPMPFTFLQVIVDTPIGAVAKNPTKTGKRSVRVTLLMKQRANLALNAKRVTKKRFAQK